MTSLSNIPNSEFRTPNLEAPAVLTIAGSDSGGGAGIQADLKTFAALGCYGTSAITCLTAQNPDTVNGVLPSDPDFVSLQIKTVCDGFSPKAAKTGMLFSAVIIKAVAAAIDESSIETLVVDPVMVATSGARLLEEDAINSLCEDLLPKATVITPNIPEAEILAGHAIPDVASARESAREIGEKFGTACVVKGGHLPGVSNRVVDILYDSELYEFEAERIDAVDTHGTGCTFSAAMAACLARGDDLPSAVKQAQYFVGRAIAQSKSVGKYSPLNHFFAP